MKRQWPYPSSRGGVLEVLRQLEERLAHQERAEAGREERDDQALIRVVPSRRSATVEKLVMIVTSNGTISVARNSTKIVRFNGKSRNANAYAGEDRGRRPARR